MALAEDFTALVDSLPDDWTDLEIDVRIADESRYVDAAVIMTSCNAQPYSHHDWHWRVLIAHRFGHAAGVPAVHLALRLLDDGGFAGQIAQREVRTGRAENFIGWGRTETVRQEFKKLHSF